MGQFSAAGLETWVVKRILGFFNRARTAKDIHEGVLLKDDPNAGTGSYIIGEVVARRILDRRNSLPGNRFTEISQLNGVRGLGQDKFRDLVYTFSVPAAGAFRAAMYARVIGQNWILEQHSVRFDDEAAFLAVANDPKAFRELVTDTIADIAVAKYDFPGAPAEARKRLKASCLKTYESGHIGSYALALWFYRFDADNWFGYEQVRRETELYLDFMPFAADRAELRMFEGFENAGFLAQAITVTDLPVVVNFAEQVVTIWTAELYD